MLFDSEIGISMRQIYSEDSQNSHWLQQKINWINLNKKRKI